MRALAIVAVVTACYSPTPAPGAPCGAGGACPTGMTCSAATQTCELNGVDAATHDSSYPLDAMPDAQPDAPHDANVTPKWALIQTATSMTSTIGFATTGSGHLIVVAILTSATPSIALVTDNTTTDVYNPVAAARSSNTNNGSGLEIWYAANSAAGATTITASGTASTIVMWEFAGVRTTAPLDVGAAMNDQPASNTPLGPPITTASNGEVIVSVAIVANSVSGTHAGNAFTNDHTPRGDGYAHLTSNAAPAGSYQTEWDQATAGAYHSSAAAFIVGP